MSTAGSAIGRIGVQLAETSLYVRIPGWSTTEDLVQHWLVGHAGRYESVGQRRRGNGCVDFLGDRLVPSSSVPTSPLTPLHGNSTTCIRGGSDECTPVRLGGRGMVIGGGHGFECRVVTTCAPHGLLPSDIGCRYVYAGQEFVLADIADGQTVRLLPRPVLGAEFWSHVEVDLPDDAVLDRVDAGRPLLASSDAADQLCPAVQNYNLAVRWDDGTSVVSGADVAWGARLVIRETYGIADLVAVYDWLVANAGLQTSLPDYGDPAISTHVNQDITYGVDWTGTVSVKIATACVAHGVVTMHGLQHQAPSRLPSRAGRVIVPRVRAPVGDQDFSAGVDIPASSWRRRFTTETWSATASPPNVIAMLVLDEDRRVTHGTASWMAKLQIDGTVVARSSALAGPDPASLEISTHQKAYLYPAYHAKTVAGMKLESHSFVTAMNPDKYAPADIGLCIEDADGWLVYLYKVAAADNVWVPIDSRLVGRTVRMRCATNGATLSSHAVSSRGVEVAFGDQSEIVIVID